MELDFEKLRELLSVFNQTDIEELTIKSDDFELAVRKGSKVARSAPSEAVWVDNNLPPTSAPPMPPVAPPSITASPAVPTPTSTPSVLEQQLLEIHSPMVGTFYRSPSPDESPFVEVGDRIGAGQTVCIIEAMKLMNELEAEVSGEIVEILVRNGEPIEFGQTLMRVKPNS